MSEHRTLDRIELNVIQGRRVAEDEGQDDDLAGTPGVVELVRSALDEGIGAEEILVDAVSSGMKKVGDKFEEGIYFLPDMLTAAETVEAAMEVLEPHLLEAGVEPRGKILLATVKGDIHDIGKNIVSLMLKGAGYETIDLGSDAAPERIVEAVRDLNVDMLGLSALLTTTMTSMAETVEELEKAGLRDGVRVVLGGAPVNAAFAAEIEADGYGRDAFEAVRLAERLISRQ